MDTHRNGVGPHPKPWPNDPRYDRDLLDNGDGRNVLDEYRYLTVDAIRADLATKRSSLHVAIENWEHDLNIGSIVRTANAFNVAGVHIIGRRHWNRRGAMVTDAYLKVYHHGSVADFVAAMGPRQIIAVDNLDGAERLSIATLPADCVLVFGNEGAGISPEMIAAAERLVYIEQQGSTRSINAAAAAAIVMYEWQRLHVLGG